MNLLRKMYEDMETAKDKKYHGGVSFIDLDPSKNQDKQAMDSFLQENFPDCIETAVANTEIFANLYETLSKLEIGVLVRYNDPKMSDKDLYFRLNALSDPALAQLLNERNAPGEAHIHVWGKDAKEALQRLKAYFEPTEKEDVQQTLKPAEYSAIKEQNGTLYTELLVPNEHGLHMRAAMQIVDTAQMYKGRFRIYNLQSGEVADAKSIMGVSMLVATKGTPLKIEAKGKEAEQALKSLIGLFENKFGEE